MTTAMTVTMGIGLAGLVVLSLAFGADWPLCTACRAHSIPERLMHDPNNKDCKYETMINVVTFGLLLVVSAAVIFMMIGISKILY